jgi:hypothetical protein
MDDAARMLASVERDGELDRVAALLDGLLPLSGRSSASAAGWRSSSQPTAA